MKLEFNIEEYMEAKLKKYTTIASVIFMIIAIYLTFKGLFILKNVAFWFLGLFITLGFCALFVFIMMKLATKKEPIIAITDDAIYCNFKQVPTKQGSLKRKFIGTYESIEELCTLNIVTHYEVTDKHIIAYGYSYENLRDLTGFVVERFFDEDDEILITTWLQNHITNICNSNTQFLDI